MKATLLGTGDPLGMPVALCDCKYCKQAPERLRPGLLVETDETTLVFDISPDIRQQLIETDTGSVDGFFATHCHVDHFGGLPDLHQLHEFAGEEVNLYGSEAVKEYLDESFSWVNLNFHRFEDEEITVGELKVTSFQITHSEFFPMQGFSIEKGERKIVYIPDLKALPDKDVYRDADLLFIDGMYLFKKHFDEDEDHASGEELKKEIEKADADRTVLVNMSEHFNKMTVREEKEKTRYEIWNDFESEEL